MSKKELISSISESANVTKLQAGNVLKAMELNAAIELRNSGEVSLPGIGRLTITTREARTGRNPRTGVAVQIPACRAIKFKVSSALKDSVQ